MKTIIDKLKKCFFYGSRNVVGNGLRGRTQRYKYRLNSPRNVPQKLACFSVTMLKNHPESSKTVIVPQKSLYFSVTPSRELVLILPSVSHTAYLKAKSRLFIIFCFTPAQSILLFSILSSKTDNSMERGLF